VIFDHRIFNMKVVWCCFDLEKCPRSKTPVPRGFHEHYW